MKGINADDGGADLDDDDRLRAAVAQLDASDGITLTPGDLAVVVPGAGGTIWCDQAERRPEREIRRGSLFTA